MDRLDLEFLKLKGKAQDILKETLDLDASQNNAVKYIAGIRHYLRHKRKLMDEDPTREIGEMEETTYKADGSLVTKRELLLSEEDSKNPQRIMELMGYDPLLWEVLTCKTRRNYWDVTIKNSASEGEKHTNHAYMCELTIKPIKSQVSSAAIREVFNELQAPKLVEVKYKPSDLLLELPLMDVHIGKQAWADETG
nr:hypothetical protein [candidate division Zixibacteria bacterium]NIU14034.1 hypothetical protein [candidate division Zixibacteria bacterium]